LLLLPTIRTSQFSGMVWGNVFNEYSHLLSSLSLSVMTVVFNTTWWHFVTDTDINPCHWQRTWFLSPAKPDVWLLQQCCWRLMYPEMWHCVGQVICAVSKSHTAFKILLTVHPLTQHVIP
jgi:hypothetical protein